MTRTVHLRLMLCGPGIAVWTLLCCAGPAAAAEVTTTPSPIALSRKYTEPVLIDIKGLPFSADLRATVNVGAVERLEPSGGGTRVVYRRPEKRFPQRLCLLLWREKDGGETVHVFRVPMLGRTVVTVRTRSYSKVVIAVGRRLFGPHDTGGRGRRRVRLFVPPGAKQATVRVTDRVGMKTTKRIAITTPSYNQLAMAVVPRRPRANRRRFRITVAAATPGKVGDRVTLEIDGRPVALKAVREGLFRTIWSPEPPAERRLVTIRASIPGRERSIRSAEVELLPPPRPVKPAVSVEEQEDRPAEPPPRGKLRGVVGLAVGMIHNTGAFFSPRASLELGLDYRLPVGWIGLHALAGVSGASQTIEGPGGLDDAESRVLLIPVGGGLTYSLPLSHVTPYLTAGLFAQLAHTTSSAPYVDQQQTHVALAVLGQAGAERRLGPGRVFLQAGFLWCRIDEPQLELLAGGVIVEAGYRLQL